MKFLVCIDGSPRSLDALPHAAKLAAATGAELVLMRVLDPRTDAAHIVAPELETALKQVEATWLAELESQLSAANVPGSAMVVRREWSKQTADAISAAAGEAGVTLIALSSRGHGAIRHALLGSVAMGVISRGADPVMTTGGRVQPPSGGAGYHLVITSDGSPDARSVFEGLRPVLAGTSVRVTLLEVVTPRPGESDAAAKLRSTENLSALTSRLPEGIHAGFEVRIAPPGAGIDTAIVTAARELGADAIAMATHGHSARRHLVAGSTALGVLGAAEVPVILVKSRPVE